MTIFVSKARAANPPNAITYQGKLLQNGALVTTTQNMYFVIYDASSGGNVLYTASGTVSATTSISVTPIKGLFSVNLGDTGTNALSPTIFRDNANVYLEVRINNDVLSPRKRITASPYAYNAKYLDGVGTNTVSSSTYIPVSDASGNFTFNSTTISTSTITNKLAVISNNTSTFNWGATLATGGGNVGISTTSPAWRLSVSGDINTTGTYRINDVDYGQYFIDSAGSNGQVWSSQGSGRGHWVNTSTLGSQPIDSDLTALAALTGPGFAYQNSVGNWVSSNTVNTAFGGTGQNSSGWTGVPWVNAGVWANSTTLNVAYGGTGANTFNQYSLLYGNGTSAIQALGVGTAGYVLQSNDGTGAPAWVATSSLGFPVIGIGAVGQVPYYAAAGRDLTATSSLFIYTNGNIGIGTSTPDAKLTIYGPDISSSTKAFTIYNASSSQIMRVTDEGNISFGNDALLYEASSTVTYVNSLETGGLSFPDNGGMITWVDMAVTSDAPTGTVESYTAMLNGNPMIMVYGESDGMGGTQNTTVSINTSTTTTAKFYIDGGTNLSNALFVNGLTGLNTTTPMSVLDVFGDIHLSGASRYLNFDSTATGSSGYGFRDNSGTMQFKNSGGNWTSFGSGSVGSSTQGYVAYYSTNGSSVTGTSYIYVSSTGYVGINSTSPNYQLDVNGDINTIGTYRLAGTDYGQYFQYMITTAGTSGQVWQSDGSGAGVWVNTNTLGFASSSGSNAYIQNQSSANQSASFRITATGTLGALGINTTSPVAQLTLVDGAILAVSSTNPVATAPVSGTGTRFMWIPGLAAIRAGSTDSLGYGDGSSWDTANIGPYSAAFGVAVKASNVASFAMGALTTASGGTAFAGGLATIAASDQAFAFGGSAYALGDTSIAMGKLVTSSAANAVAIGSNLIASGTNAVAMGNRITVTGNNSFGIGLSTNNTYLPVNNTFGIMDGAILASGTNGNTPTAGAGTRMMWVPSLAAFRAGQVDGAEWDNANIGNHSVAFGQNTTSSGESSIAMGYNTAATGNFGSFAVGNNTVASNQAAVATGYYTTASGMFSTAMGYYTVANGAESTALGYYTTSSGAYSLSTGSWTTASGDQSTAMGANITVSGLRSFGIGLDQNSRTVSANSVMAIMGGNVGIGSTTPQALLTLTDGAILAVSSSNPVTTVPVSGTGTRMMWIPGKAAFRAGMTYDYYPGPGAIGDGTAWNDANIGSSSVAFGVATKASGYDSFAAGASTTVNGPAAAAFGYNNIASNTASFAIGMNNYVDGMSSFVGGSNSSSSVQNSFAFGYSVGAQADTSVALVSKISVSGPRSLGIGLSNTNYYTITQAGTMAIMGGKVGVNSTTPGTDFVVAGTSTMQDIIPYAPYTGNMSNYSIGASTTRWNSMWAGTYNVGTSTWSLTTGVNNRLQIFDGQAGTGNERMTILQNGYVGIGSTTPAYKLTAVGTDSDDANNVVTNAQFGVEGSTPKGTYIRERGNSAGISGITYANQLIFKGGSASEIYMVEDSPLVFGNNATERMRINSGGNVGIGTTSPAWMLSVNGDINTTGTYRINNVDYGQYFIDSAGTDGYVWKSDGSGRGVWVSTSSLNITAAMPANSAGQTLVGAGGTTWNATSALFVSPNSYVGINSTSPQAMLTVVDGAILAVSSTNPVATAPVTGTGTRMMWIPGLAAFRAGTVGYAQNGNGWDTANIGLGSTAFGVDVKAAGVVSFAEGYNSVALGTGDIAMGPNNTSNGNAAVTLGSGNLAMGQSAIAIGQNVTASGSQSIAMGKVMAVTGNNSFGIGLDNTPRTTSANSVMSIMGGNVGIGSTTPQALLTLTDGAILAVSSTNPVATAPVTGTGARFMWIPGLAAIRAGEVGNTFGGQLSSDGTEWNTSNIGQWSAAFGLDNKAPGGASFIAGIQNIATNYAAIALGMQNYSSGTASIALGSSNTSTKDGTAAIGSSNIADATGAIAIGAGNYSAGYVSYALGSFNTSTGQYSTAMGNRITVSGNNSFGIGLGNGPNNGTLSATSTLGIMNGAILASGIIGNTPASGAGTRMMWIPAKAAFRAGIVSGSEWDDTNIGANSFAAGAYNQASGAASAAFGQLSSALGDYSFAAGYGSSASNTYTIAMGYDALATNTYSIAMGRLVTAGGSSAVAMGYHDQANGSASFAAGEWNQATAEAAVAMGDSNTASGGSSFAAGSNNTASGYYSVALGQSNTAAGGGTGSGFALGISNSANISSVLGASVAIGESNYNYGGRGVSVIGYSNTAYGYWGNVAMGYASLARGTYGNLALGYYSTAGGYTGNAAMGYWTTATGTSGGSIALGYLTQASGSYGSTALGSNMTVSGNYSLGIGLSSTPYTISQDNTMAVMGGNVGIGSTTPQALLTINDGVILAVSSTNPVATVPVTGTGTRMMWIPGKAAFRAGYVQKDHWDDTNIAAYSVALGYDTVASGTFGSLAAGYLSTANGSYGATALGYNSKASGGTGATAIGDSVQATGDIGATAMGLSTKASGGYGATALGMNTTASGTYGATALGTYSVASGTSAFAAGRYAYAYGNYSVALGNSITANGIDSLALGYAIRVYGDYSLGIGLDGTTRNVSSSNVMAVMGGNVGIGSTTPQAMLTIADGAILAASTTNNPITTSLAANTTTAFMWLPGKAALRAGASASGMFDMPGTDGTSWNDANMGMFSTAFGLSNKASGLISTAIGVFNIASGTASFAGGAYSIAGKDQALAYGMDTQAMGAASIAMGLTAHATNDNSFAIGKNVTSTGNPSFAMGYNMIVTGNKSFGIGLSNTTYTISGDNTMAIMGANVGINSTSPQATFTISDGAILAASTTNNAVTTTPVNGAGTRLMWVPGIASFRAGEVGNNNLLTDPFGGSEWDTANVGKWSASFGLNNKASGMWSFIAGAFNQATSDGSVALGVMANATGKNSFSWGGFVTSSGQNSLAMGKSTVASGDTSVAIGQNATAGNSNAFALGQQINVTGANSFGIGLYTSGAASNVIGNNVFAVMDGKMGINTGTPLSALDVYGDIHVSSSAALTYINFSPTTTGVNGYGIRDNLGTMEFKNNNGTWSAISANNVGSGTTGQIPYYAANGTTLTATSSIFIDVNRRVGIGTTSPAQALDVVGNIDNTMVSGTAVSVVSTLSPANENGPIAMNVLGRYGYFADSGQHRIHVADFSDPNNPKDMGSAGYVWGGAASGMYVSGRYAYIVSAVSSSLIIWDISNPVIQSGAPPSGNFISTTTVVTSTNPNAVPATPNGIVVVGKIAYIIASTTDPTYPGAIIAYDISNPYAPKVLNANTVSGARPTSIFAQGRYLYVTYDDNSLTGFDTDDVGLNYRGFTGTSLNNPKSVYVSGRYAYVANYGNNTLEIIDASDNHGSGNLYVVKSTITVGTNPISVFVSGRYAYVANYGSANVSIVDVSSSTAPVVMGTVSVGTNPSSIYVSGRYAYVTNKGSNTISVIDISGTEVTSLMAGGGEFGNLQVRNNIFSQGDILANSLTAGEGGINSNGPLTANGSIMSVMDPTQAYRGNEFQPVVAGGQVAFAWYPVRQSLYAGTAPGLLGTGGWNFYNNNVDYSAIFGSSNNPDHSDDIIMAGANNVAFNSSYSAIFGYSNTATSNANYSIMGGYQNYASGSPYTYLFGYNNRVNAVATGYNYALGHDNNITASDVQILGNNITVTSSVSHVVAIGVTTTANTFTITRSGVVAIMGGKVGINTGAPTSTLDVEGSIELSLSASTNNFALCHETNGASADQQIKDCSGAPSADYMEMYAMEQTLSTGDIVAASDDMVTTSITSTSGGLIEVPRMVKATLDKPQRLIGIVSNINNAGDFNSIGYNNFAPSDNVLPLALSGRVEVKVTNKNGAIHTGDKITISDIAGVGMKATGEGPTVGIALGNYDSPDVGYILAFVNLGWNNTLYKGLSVNSDTNQIFAGTSTNQYSLVLSGNFSVAGTSYLGTVASGTWHGNAIEPAYGGTGQNSASWSGWAKVSGGVWSAASINTSDLSDYNSLAYLGNAQTFTGEKTFSATTTLAATLAANLQVNSTSTLNGAVMVGNYLQYTSSGDNYIYFNNTTSAYLQWNNTSQRFDLSHSLNVNGSVTSTNLSLSGNLSFTSANTNTISFATTSVFTSNVSNYSGARSFIFNALNFNTTTADRYVISVRSGNEPVFSVAANGDVNTIGRIYAASTNVSKPGNPGDLAETVDIAIDDNVEPGDVMMVDPSAPDTYRRTSQEYEQSVAGVISTDPSITVGDGKTDYKAVLAMIGRVPVKVSNINGSVKRGDLLVASSIKGYAMKYDATKDNSLKMVGIIGIALENQDESNGQGKVMALIRTGWIYNRDQTIASVQTHIQEIATAQGINLSADAAPGNLNINGNTTQLSYSGGTLNLNNNAIVNVVAIVGANNQWRIDADGSLVSRVQTSEGEKDVYAMQSVNPEYVFSSSSQLSAGQAMINYDTSTREIIDFSQPVKISVTLTSGEGNGIFVAQKSETGFVVKELGNGTSSSTFDWIVVAKRKMQAISQTTVNTQPADTTQAPVQTDTAVVNQPAPATTPSSTESNTVSSTPATNVSTSPAVPVDTTSATTPAPIAPTDTTVAPVAPADTTVTSPAPVDTAPTAPADTTPAPAPAPEPAAPPADSGATQVAVP